MERSAIPLRKWLIAILPAQGEHQGRLQRQAGGLPRHHAEVRLVLGTPHPRCSRRRPAAVSGAGRGPPINAKERNKNLNAGRRAVGKAAVVGFKDHDSGKVAAALTAIVDQG